jgi:hypothetical protein
MINDRLKCGRIGAASSNVFYRATRLLSRLRGVPYEIRIGGDMFRRIRTDFELTVANALLEWETIPTRDERATMPMQPQEQETLNVKLVHFTKQNSPEEPVQVAFSVIDEQGKEEIITGEIPYSYDLFRLLQENGWLNIRRGVSSIREARTQRRSASA